MNIKKFIKSFPPQCESYQSKINIITLIIICRLLFMLFEYVGFINFDYFCAAMSYKFKESELNQLISIRVDTNNSQIS